MRSAIAIEGRRWPSLIARGITSLPPSPDTSAYTTARASGSVRKRVVKEKGVRNLLSVSIRLLKRRLEQDAALMKTVKRIILDLTP